MLLATSNIACFVSPFPVFQLYIYFEPRMHSSRMRSVRSSDHILGGGVSAPGGVYSRGVSAPGGCLLPVGVSAPGGCLLPGGSALGGGVCSRGGVCPGGGACSRGVWYPSMHWGRHPQPPCGQTDVCKNITFATSLRTVIRRYLVALCSVWVEPNWPLCVVGTGWRDRWMLWIRTWWTTRSETSGGSCTSWRRASRTCLPPRKSPPRSVSLMAGLFTLSDSDSFSDSKPNGYIELCRSFHTAMSQIQIPILTTNYRNGIGIRTHTRVRLPQCKWAIRIYSHMR